MGQGHVMLDMKTVPVSYGHQGDAELKRQAWGSLIWDVTVLVHTDVRCLSSHPGCGSHTSPGMCVENPKISCGSQIEKNWVPKSLAFKNNLTIYGEKNTMEKVFISYVNRNLMNNNMIWSKEEFEGITLKPN